ncbi:putative extracellular triacylglycerol lipase precursor [Lyophyllum shimeji]|uniref:Carboxylic ester hydrolase n=1 Tax=Lyophyllum shimeji TaxID=47721 RepID=A0A9P3PUT5_LYOSH|nr:putative extracellular triacylglycerol lipase precursor [Lyophyllum shimeji]
MSLSLIPFLCSLLTLVCASTVTVQIGNVSVIGNYNSTSGVDQFLGLKYGSSTRFRRASAQSYSNRGVINATQHGPACPQIKGTNSLAVNYGIYGTDEDCTLLDIYRPHYIPRGTLLPVMLWLHGGALTQGAAWYYPGDGIVQESSRINLPVITVVINYRLAAWGFLGGKEAADNGALNLGLYDQQLALQWVQNYISNFGGDNSKVTVFGQSSGAMSIAYHMLTVNTKLFTGAILESGTSTSVPALAAEAYQGNYDALVSIAGCSGSSDTFECLRTMDRDALINATNTMFSQPSSYGSRPWGVSIDGEIIPDNPSILTARGQIAQIPFIAGNVMDEGTIFVKPQTISTDDDLLTFLEKDYLNRNASFFQNATSIATLEVLYPNDPSLGCPYGTGNETFFGTQFKRGASIYGDIHFHWARRNFLNTAVSNGVLSWSYLFDQFTPTNAAWQGVLHTGEIPYVFMKFSPSDGDLYALSRQMLAYWVSFAYNRNPYYKYNPIWEKYSKASQNIVFTAANTSMQPDDYRSAGMSFIGSISDQFLEPRA